MEENKSQIEYKHKG